MEWEENLRQLLLYHEYDQKFHEKNRSLEMGKVEIEKLMEGHRLQMAHVEEIEGELQRQRDAWEKSEDLLAKRKEKWVLLREKMKFMGNCAQIDALDGTMKSIQTQVSDGEMEQLSIIEHMEAMEKELRIAKENSQRENFEQSLRAWEDRHRSMGENLEDMREKMEGIQSSIIPQLMARYMHLRHSISSPPFMVKLDGNFCCGCRMRLPREIDPLSSLKQGELITCDFCHRILYALPPN
ncbi:MAG: hypothetical protein LBG86_02195 [Puniceicoccales bacterium]|jgi:predicted  nucleic acid-binding Zn-ribbon protein|nr:hypothetical protein [Puniceicoccales bacterium]